MLPLRNAAILPEIVNKEKLPRRRARGVQIQNAKAETKFLPVKNKRVTTALRKIFSCCLITRKTAKGPLESDNPPV
jgi:hypothetical protein